MYIQDILFQMALLQRKCVYDGGQQKFYDLIKGKMFLYDCNFKGKTLQTTIIKSGKKWKTRLAIHRLSYLVISI